jgi:undecaprenyl-phosphate 4-deoxy-4-formamido-L-arabinose transferase
MIDTIVSPPLTGKTNGEQPPRPSLSVIVPVYNSQETLAPLVDRLNSVLERVANDFEVILVNDGSRDNSWRVAMELSEAHPFLRAINLMRNYGQHNALLAGIRVARHELIVTLDDDLQNPPEEIPSLLAKLEQGYDVVYGVPNTNGTGFCATSRRK